MLIIFKRIPNRIDKYHLETLVKSTLQSAGWFHRGELKHFQMVQVEDNIGNVLEYQYVALIEPDKAALRIIKRLNDFTFMKTTLHVATYVVRSWHNDRRRIGDLAGIQQKRRYERRRAMLFYSR
jgi:hypothetical protein